MKDRCLRILEKVGHFQAQLLLSLMFLLLLTPYALLLRLFGQGRLPKGGWQTIEQQRSDLASLRRTF